MQKCRAGTVSAEGSVAVLYSYQNEGLYFHHSLDESPREAQFVMHAHENCELYFFLRGEGTYFVEGNEYRLSPRCLLLMRPGETHKAQLSSSSPYERMAIHFSPRLLESVDPQGELLLPFYERQVGRMNLYRPEEYDAPFVLNCLNAMTRPAGEGDAARQLAVMCNLPPVLLELRRAFAKIHCGEPAGPNRENEPQSRIGSVVEYINDNLTEDLNLTGLAARFFVSKSYLNQQFRQATGTTVWNYILLKRLMIARAAIRDGVSVTDAFARSGFNDYSAFYRRYRDRFGVSPKDDLPKKQN